MTEIPSPQESASKKKPSRSGHSKSSKSLVVILLLLLVVGYLVRQDESSSFEFDELAVEDELRSLVDPRPKLNELWQSGMIPQRRLAMLNIRNKVQDDEHPQWRQFLFDELYPEGLIDPDIHIRELILSCLSRIHSTKKQELDLGTETDSVTASAELDEFEKQWLIPACLIQLKDMDPEVRLMGIQFARNLADKSPMVHAVAAQLSDPNPRLFSQAAAFLQLATGQDFGIKLVHLPKDTRVTQIPGMQEKIQKWQDFLKTNQSAWTNAEAQITLPTFKSPHLSHEYMNLNFQTMDGKKLSLAQFRGKVVLLSFWTTWCTPCLEELPALDKIHRAHSDRIAIFPVSLDGIPSIYGIRDEDGKFIDDSTGDLKIHREKIENMTETLGIQMNIVWDHQNRIAGRYKGDELPTQAIYDPSGHLVRVFTGSRSEADWMRIFEGIAQSPAPH